MRHTNPHLIAERGIMPFARNGPVALYYEVTGRGTPVVFVHEFSGDHRSWEPQVRYFSRRYFCVSYDARGYPPSDVPPDPAAYSQDLAVSDLLCLLDHLEVGRAHIVGLSMGGFTALHFGLRYPERARSLAIAGVGYGSTANHDRSWLDDVAGLAQFYEEDLAGAAASHASAPGRVAFMVKDPRGWAEFAGQLAEHSSAGSARTMRGVQGGRPNLYDLRDELAGLSVPLLVITGDEDEPCLEPSIFLKRTVPTAGLAMLPRAGHTVNLEEPAAFNQLVQDLFSTVDAGRWSPRDPRSLASKQLGHR
jgi:pimeloyl-ACP methyl ester carboxylesterase